MISGVVESSPVGSLLHRESAWRQSPFAPRPTHTRSLSLSSKEINKPFFKKKYIANEICCLNILILNIKDANSEWKLILGENERSDKRISK